MQEKKHHHDDDDDDDDDGTSDVSLSRKLKHYCGSLNDGCQDEDSYMQQAKDRHHMKQLMNESASDPQLIFQFDVNTKDCIRRIRLEEAQDDEQVVVEKQQRENFQNRQTTFEGAIPFVQETTRRKKCKVKGW